MLPAWLGCSLRPGPARPPIPAALPAVPVDGAMQYEESFHTHFSEDCGARGGFFALSPCPS